MKAGIVSMKTKMKKRVKIKKSDKYAESVYTAAEKSFDILKEWKLSYAEDDGGDFEYKSVKDTEMAGKPLISASVPGNFELDLLKAGILKKDPYIGDGCLELRKYEYCHIFYSCTFEWSEDLEEGETAALCAEGIDTIADVYLNDKKIGSCENMFIENRFDLDGIRRGINEIFIHIRPAAAEARKYAGGIGDGSMSYSYESLYIRKAAHSFGWDIAPRAVSGGIWRPIYIVKMRPPKIKECYLISDNYNAETKIGTAHLRYIMDVAGDKLDEYRIIIDGVCGESSFHVEHKPWFVAGRVGFEIENCKRWNVRGRGAANLYDVTVLLVRGGEVVDYKKLKFGHRKVRLLNTETVDENGSGEFRFVINDEPVFIMGTNWVPADMFHSKDKDRIPKILKLAADCGCNMIRCWGGNVYEDDSFYDLCDRLGILVWQDFAMACGTYPRGERMQKLIGDEAASVVRRLRQHPCVCIWAGDNECDIMQMPMCDPNLNLLTRQVLPQVINAHDGTRPYLPSSPYVSKAAYKTNRNAITEQHLWGPRDRFKGDYYAKTNACFASEIGYHGCPSPNSVRRFITDEGDIDLNSRQCILHCSSPEYPGGEFTYRNGLMKRQVKTLFGRDAGGIEEFAAMSQISQAEADKFFIESFRIKKDRCGGIIWWNIMDCWPQFSDAVVDYYFVKKLAYHYIRLSQQQFLCAMNDDSGTLDGWAINDYPFDIMCEYRVINTETGTVEFEGKCAVEKDKALKLFSSEKPAVNTFYKLEWRIRKNGSDDFIKNICGVNHYICFDGTIDFEHYTEKMTCIPEYKFEGFNM